MHRTTSVRTLAAVFGVWLLLYGAATAQAHEGSARLDLDTNRLPPGATFELRGINVAPELPVWLTLIGSGQELPVGETLGDEHGDFTQVIVLPSDLATGEYVLQATSPNLVIVSVQLIIEGTPIISGEAENGGRDEDDPLLATLPPDWNVERVRVDPPAAPTQAPTSTAPAPAAPDSTPLMALGGLVVLGLVIAVGWRAMRGR